MQSGLQYAFSGEMHGLMRDANDRLVYPTFASIKYRVIILFLFIYQFFSGFLMFVQYNYKAECDGSMLI